MQPNALNSPAFNATYSILIPEAHLDTGLSHYLSCSSMWWMDMSPALFLVGHHQPHPANLNTSPLSMLTDILHSHFASPSIICLWFYELHSQLTSFWEALATFWIHYKQTFIGFHVRSWFHYLSQEFNQICHTWATLEIFQNVQTHYVYLYIQVISQLRNARWNGL